MNITKVNMTLDPKDYRGFALDSFVKENPSTTMADLANLGITMDESIVENPLVMNVIKTYAKAHAGDAADLVMGNATAVTPLQFAQFWLPDVINAIYRGRTADKIFGSENVGTWETEQVVATKLERTGKPALYDDFSKAPLANWNIGFETRDNIRFEMGIECTKLEEARAAQMKQNAYQMKRSALQLGMDILMNHVKWYGYNNGAKKVYGILNDPGLTPAETLPLGSGVTIETATAEQLISMLNQVIQDTATRLMGNWSPDEELVMVLPLSWQTAFSRINSYGISPKKWLAENYPRVRVEIAPELVDSGSTAGLDKCIVYVPQVAEVGKTMSLMDSSKLRLVGAVPTVKGFEESYSSSTIGALVRCPLAIQIYEA